MKSDIAVLENSLGYSFNNRGFLTEALIHSSYAHEQNLKCTNERFEFLGDAVIHLVLTEFLVNKYPNADEGTLSSVRSYCESEPMLHEKALEINLGEYIMFGKGETLAGGKFKESLLANTFEAVIAAVYQDGGFKSAKKVVLSILSDTLEEVWTDKSYIDSKSELQRYTQKYFGILPTYDLVAEDGEDHRKTFTVSSTINAKGALQSTIGMGRTKKLAEKDAAHKLLKILDETKRTP